MARPGDNRRRWLGPLLVVVLAVAVGLVWLAARADDTQDAAVVTPAPEVDAVLGIWPYATAEQADAADDSADDPVRIATDFLATIAEDDDTFLVRDSTVEDDTATVVAVAGPAEWRTTVTLRTIGEEDRWTVVRATANGLELEAPEPAEKVSSPVDVRGRATAFEGTVLLEVVSGGRPLETLGEGVATGEQGELRPFAAGIDFQLSLDEVGAVIATTTSAQDGSVEQVAAVPIRWEAQPSEDQPASLPTGEPLADDEVVAVVAVAGEGDDPADQEVVVLGPDGERRRTLLTTGTAEGGVLDVSVTPDRQTVLVSESTSACESRLVAVPADGASRPTPFGEGEAVAVSPEGDRLAVALDGDCDRHHAIEIRSMDGEVIATFGEDAAETAGLPRTLESELVAFVRELVWADDGTIAYEVQYEDGPALFVLDVDGDGRDERLRPEDPARVWHAPARDAGGRLTVVEATLRQITPQADRLVAIDVDGTVVEDLGALEGEVQLHLWRGGAVLWLDAGRLLQRVDGRPHLVAEGIVRAAA